MTDNKNDKTDSIFAKPGRDNSEVVDFRAVRGFISMPNDVK